MNTRWYCAYLTSILPANADDPLDRHILPPVCFYQLFSPPSEVPRKLQVLGIPRFSISPISSKIFAGKTVGIRYGFDPAVKSNLPVCKPMMGAKVQYCKYGINPDKDCLHSNKPCVDLCRNFSNASLRLLKVPSAGAATVMVMNSELLESGMLWWGYLYRPILLKHSCADIDSCRIR